MTFKLQAEKQTSDAVDSLVDAVTEALRRELQHLRTDLDARLAALEAAPALTEHGTLVARLVDELSDVASRQADEAAARAREKSEEDARLRLAAVEAESQAHLDDERRRAEAFAKTVDGLQAQLREVTLAAQAEAQTRAELTSALDDARAQNAGLSASLDASRHESASARHELEERSARLEAIGARLEAVEEEHRVSQQSLADTEARLASEARNRAALADALQQATQEASIAKNDADAALAQLSSDNQSLRRAVEELQSQAQAAAAAARIEIDAVRAELNAAIEDARVERDTLASAVRVAHDEASAALARVAAEADTRAALEASLKAAQDAVSSAGTDAESTRAELDAAQSKIYKLQLQVAAQRGDAALLARVRRSLRAFAGLTRTREVFDTFLDGFGREFDRVALFEVRDNRLEGWRSIGFEPTTDVKNLVIPMTMESPLARAAADAKSILLDSGRGPKTGLLGHEAFCVMAIPIFKADRVVAVAYAELARKPEEGTRLASLHLAEVLVEQATQSLAHVHDAAAVAPVHSETSVAHAGAVQVPEAAEVQPPQVLSFSGPPRAAARLRLPDALDVTVDGGAAVLVDISTLGAQVLCSKALRPNHQVRMLLPQNGQPMLCQGRVVWALFEMKSGGGRYRAGLKFTNVDNAAMDAFVSQYAADQQRTSA